LVKSTCFSRSGVIDMPDMIASKRLF